MHRLAAGQVAHGGSPFAREPLTDEPDPRGAARPARSRLLLARHPLAGAVAPAPVVQQVGACTSNTSSVELDDVPAPRPASGLIADLDHVIREFTCDSQAPSQGFGE